MTNHNCVYILPPAMQETQVRILDGEDPPEKGQATHSSILGLPGGSDGKASVYNAGDLGSIPGSGRSAGEGNGNPLQHYCLENPMDRGAWQATQSMGLQRVGHDWATSLSFHFKEGRLHPVGAVFGRK